MAIPTRAPMWRRGCGCRMRTVSRPKAGQNGLSHEPAPRFLSGNEKRDRATVGSVLWSHMGSRQGLQRAIRPRGQYGASACAACRGCSLQGKGAAMTPERAAEIVQSILDSGGWKHECTKEEEREIKA